MTIAVVIALVILAVIFSSSQHATTSSSSSSSAVGAPNLTARVTFTGVRFTVENQDFFDWTDCDFSLNPHGLSLGYRLKTSGIKAGKSAAINSLDFADSDNRRFNPLGFKVETLYLECETPAGHRATAVGFGSR
jgi:hypothetical protein